MAVVLTATGFFLYLRLRSELDNRLNQNLHARLQVVSTLLERGAAGGAEAAVRGGGSGRDGSGFAQIIGSGGTIVAGTEGLHHTPLLSGAEIAKVRTGTHSFDIDADLADLGPIRVLAGPVHARRGPLVAAVGTSLEDRNQALSNLRTLLLIGEPVALLLAGLAAYAVISAALRPVEAMRRRAAAISAEDLGQRLPLSPSRDELRRLGETLNAMLVRLEGGLIRERAFVADASHEFRTPLTMMKAELELMRSERPSGASYDAALASAIEDADRLARLTDDLLVLARTDGTQLPAGAEPVDVAELLEEVAGRYEESEVGAERPAAGSGPLRITADRDRLERALSNLVDNALRYGAPPVTLAAHERDGYVELHVTDAGPGFPPAFIAHAFERFRQADGSHGNEGAGLGLAITRAIAEAHGGSATAANRPEGGADVWISLPRTAPPA
jgi:signal transduction histidine kinase